MQKMIKMMALKQVGLNNYCIIEQIMVDQIKLNTVSNVRQKFYLPTELSKKENGDIIALKNILN